MALTAREIQDAYVTFFNRAADTSGFNYWTSYGGSISDLYATFAEQTEYTAMYASKTTEQQIETIYQNLFNRAPEADGLAYWTPLVEDGLITLANLALTINRGALGADSDALTAKVNAAISETETAIDGAANAGTTFTLTSAAAGDSLVGTTKNDTFTSEAGTLQTADTILDSTATDRDVLNAVVTSNSIAARIQNVETMNLTGRFATTGFDLASTSGTQNLNLNTNIVGGTATVTNASTLNAANISAGANIGTVSVTATASGTRDAVMVDAGSATTVTVAGGAGADQFTVNLASGAAGTFNGGGSVDAYTVNVGATATLTGNTATESIAINAAQDSVVTLGGALTDTVANVATATTTVGGAGNVTVKGTKAQLTGTSMTKTGSGTLTVEVTNGADTIDTKAILADTVTLAVTSGGNTGMTFNEGSTVNLKGTQTDAVLQIENAKGTITTGSLNVNVSNAQTKITTGDNVDTLILRGTPDAVTDTDADQNGVNELALVLGDVVLDAATTTLVTSGDTAMTITTLTAGAGYVLSSDMTAGLTITDTAGAFDATFSLGGGNDTVSDTVDGQVATVYGNGGNDKITTGGGDDKIYGGDGNDTLNGAAGADTISGGDGDDTINGGAGVDSITTGSGSDIVVLASGEDGDTIKDFNVDTDTLVLTGATVSLDLSSVTPTTGAYNIDGAGTFDTTFTGFTTKDMSGFVQLGRVLSTGAIEASTFAADATIVAGAKSDYIELATKLTSTITTGAGNDVISLAVVGSGDTVTVKDFTVGSDKIVIHGTGAADVDLSAAVTPSSGAYSLDTQGAATGWSFTLQNGGSALTNTSLANIVQLGQVGTAFTMADATTITGGNFNDVVAFAATTAANTYNFVDNNGVDTLTALVIGEDFVNFDKITGINGSGIDVAANATKTADAVNGEIYVFANAGDGAGTSKVTTFTASAANGVTEATILADVAAFLEANLGEADGEKYVAVLNDGTTKAYAYLVVGDADGIQADNVTLLGTIDASTAGAITATEVS